MLYYNCDHSKVSKLYINAQQYASKVLNTQAGNSIGLKTAVEALGLEIDETFHDAFNDALYTAKVFKQVHPDMITPSVFNVESIIPKKPVATKMNTRALLEYFEKSLERQLTPEEAAIIRTAYKFGKNQTFEHKPR